MSTELTPLKPTRVAELVRDGTAVLVDVREPDEFARRRVGGALSHPLSAIGRKRLQAPPGRDIVFTCRTGMRTAAFCRELRQAVDRPAFVLEGGLDAWIAAGLPVEEGRNRG